MTGNLDTSKWTSRSPPLQFPSKYYMALSRHGPENNDGAIPLHTHSSADYYHSGGHEKLYKDDIIKKINNM